MSTRYSMVITAGSDMNRQPLLKYQDRSKFLRALSNLIDGISAGNERAGVVDLQLDDGTSGVAGTPPSQTVVYSGSNGAQTCTIGGKQVSFSAGVNDTATGDALVAAIAADAVLSLGFSAANVTGTVTVKAKVHARLYGAVNGITIAVTGTGATATAATLTGGVSAPANGFSL